MVKSRYTLPGTDDQWTTSLNKYGVDSKVAFRNLVTLSTSLHYGNWEHTLQVHYRDGYTDKSFDADADCMFYDDNGTCFGGALTIPSLTTFDWRTAWDMTKNVSVVLGIENMFDKAPPRSLRSTGSHQLGYDPRYASPYLRTFVLSASVKY